MAAPKFEQLFIPTYVRLFISDSNNLKDFVIAHGSPLKDKINEDGNNLNKAIVSDLQVSNAINGPFGNLFQALFHHFAKIIAARIELSMDESDFFKREAHHKNPLKIPERVIGKISLAETDNYLGQFNEAVASQVDKWRDQADAWSSQVIDALISATGLAFSEIEEKEFLDDEPMSDIFDRFTELKIEFPKMKKGEMNFARYYKLKCTVALNSILYREQKTDQKNDVNKMLKPLKSLFDKITQEQNELLLASQSELSTLLAPFAYELNLDHQAS